MSVASSIDKIVELAWQEKDLATFDWLKWFVEEQRDAEIKARNILDRVAVIGTGATGLYEIDKMLGKLAESLTRMRNNIASIVGKRRLELLHHIEADVVGRSSSSSRLAFPAINLSNCSLRRWQPLGFVNVTTHHDYFTGEAHGHIGDIAVAKEAEGRGVSQMLMATAEAWSREKGHRLLTLNVFAANQRAIAVYEKAGFRVDTIKYLKPL